MQYLLARDGQQLGQFSEEEIRSGLFEGRYLSTDSAWTEGMDDWKPLGEIMGQGVTRLASPNPASMTPTAPRPAPRATGIAIAALALVGVAVLASLSMGAMSSMREKKAMSEGLATAGKITQAIKLHVASTGGKFPATLEEMVTAQVIGQDLLDQSKAFKPSGWTGEPGFEYHGAGMADAAGGGKPLFTSRCSDAKGRKLLVNSDGSMKLSEPAAR